jgi:hypothetical protein
VDKNKRYQELLIKRDKAREKLNRAKEALGTGSWHEDSVYELADSEFRVYSEYLESIEKEIAKLERDEN